MNFFANDTALDLQVNLNIEMYSGSRPTLLRSRPSKKRYAEKLKIVGIAECPYTVPAELWKNNPTYKPNLEYPEVYQYFIKSPGNFTRESMANRKSLKHIIYS